MVKIENYYEFGKKYEIKDGLIHTNGSVGLLKQVKKLPFQFGEVGGNFNCYNNSLTTLEGSPTSVGSNFDCSDNKLTTLEGAPTSVGGEFECYNNKLISLEGAPKSVGGYLTLNWSKDLPMLRLLIYKKIAIHENDQIRNIFEKHLNQQNKKKAILDCQKDLMDNGFIGNAGW